jgi:tetratricopeptide (TPR) repeat protein
VANEQQLLAKAFGLFQQQRLDEAAALFQDILAKNRRNFDAAHFLGLVNASKGNFAEAKKLLKTSLATKTNFAAYLENYASVLFQAKDFGEAAKVSADAIKSKGASETLQYVLAISLYKLGRLDESLAEFDQLLDRFPRNIAATNEKAAVLAELGRIQEALAQTESALALVPGYPPGLLNRGNILAKLNRHDEALKDFVEASTRAPELVEALVRAGQSYRALGRYREADQAFISALATQPDLEAGWLGRADVFSDLKRYDEAADIFDKLLTLHPSSLSGRLERGKLFAWRKRNNEALADFDYVLSIDPDSGDAWLGRGNVLADLKQYDDAFAAFDRAIAINPHLEGGWVGRGRALIDLARYDEALAAYAEGLGLCPGAQELRFAQALIKLTLGDFATGWDLYEQRFESVDKVYYATVLKKLNLKVRPDKTDLAGKIVAVLAEQGLGDEIMFSSVLCDLAVDAKAVSCECDPRLLPLFARSFPSVDFMPRQDVPAVPADTEVVVKEASLARIYRRDAAAFPQCAHLKADSARATEWRKQLDEQAAGRLKIGISWRGGVAQTRTNDRSIELARLDVLTDVPNTCFFNLQYGEVADELARFNQTHPGSTIARPFADTSNNIDELAALISALDLVISVQNTTVHLSGALGVPCWGIIPFRPEWRYGAQGRDMIWYPSVELFRQPKAGDWDAVLQDVRSRLAERAASRRG